MNLEKKLRPNLIVECNVSLRISDWSGPCFRRFDTFSIKILFHRLEICNTIFGIDVDYGKQVWIIDLYFISVFEVSIKLGENN